MKQVINKLSSKGLAATIVATLLSSGGIMLATIAKWSVWHDEGFSIMLAQYPVKELTT
jgi:hypothetical protein